MKKFISSLLFVFGFVASMAVVKCFSDPPKLVNGVRYPPFINNYISEAVYMSSLTCAIEGSSGTDAVVISSRPVELYSVKITSAGNSGSILQLFDSQLSTSGVPWITPPINAGSRDLESVWNVASSSGLTIQSNGSPAPCVAIIYVERHN